MLMCRREGIECVDFPNGCRRINTPKGLRLIPVEMPFDFLICRDGLSACVDTKTTQENTFIYSSIVPHQLRALSAVGNHIAAGYVVWFRTIDRVVFYDHLTLQRLRPNTSLKPENGVLLGTVGSGKIERVFKTKTQSKVQQSLF